jgi:hypothetical protein
MPAVITQIEPDPPSVKQTLPKGNMTGAGCLYGPGSANDDGTDHATAPNDLS